MRGEEGEGEGEGNVGVERQDPSLMWCKGEGVGGSPFFLSDTINPHPNPHHLLRRLSLSHDQESFRQHTG